MLVSPRLIRHPIKPDMIANNKGTGIKALSLANGQKITAKFVLLCGNAYLQNIGTRKMTSRLAPVTSSVLATTPLSDNLISHILPHRAAVADCNTALNYYRIDADGRMIFGGRASYTNVNLGNVERDLKQRMVERLSRTWRKRNSRGLVRPYRHHGKPDTAFRNRR